MSGIRGNRHLAGTWAEITWNGIKILEFTKVSLKITWNREEVQTGFDVDTKMTGQKGEGTMTLARVYSSFEDVRQRMVNGEDVRGVMTTKLADPDATNGQIERYQVSNIALNEFPLEYEKGTVVKSEIPFGFTPSDMICLDQISA